MTIPPTVLIIIDGFGFNPNTEGNAIYAAKTPNLDYLWSNFPHTLIKAAEEEVGLSFGQIGNSEVGHMAIGSGRVIPSPFGRINIAIETGQFLTNPGLLAAINHAKTHNSKLHIIGLASSAGVHGELNHILATANLAKSQGLTQVYIHPILDGRDTGPREAKIHLGRLVGTNIATIGGRAFAMDRNNNLDRTQAYLAALVGTAKASSKPALDTLQDYYDQSLDDENIPPTIIDPLGKIETNDAIIITNFREDRARQLTHTLIDCPQKPFIVTMVDYEKGLPVTVAFPSEGNKNTLSDVLEVSGLSQLHIGETEKYAHVTYFFNAGREAKLPHEDYVNIPSDSPDKFLDNPAMQASKIAQAVVDDLRAHKHNFYIINFANPDMIGHTGNWEKTILAIEAVDTAVGHIMQEILLQNGFIFLTADHGNSELKIDLLTKKNSKDHTINPVPFIIAANHLKLAQSIPNHITFGSQVTGILQDVAPTILTLLKLPVPPEITGVPLMLENR